MLRTSFILLSMIFFATSLFAQNSVWSANPDVVQTQQENRPDFIWDETYVPDYQLPDLLTTGDGNQIESAGQWPERRAEILEIFRDQMYGRRPGQPQNLSFNLIEENPDAMSGEATLRRIAIESEHEGRTHEFELTLFLPNNAVGASPLFLLMNNRGLNNTDPTRREKSGFWPAEEVVDRGYAIGAIQNNDLAPDDQEEFINGVIRLFEGNVSIEDRAPDAWMALAAWGWGASRAMDYFEKDPDIDQEKIALLGHSRGGKASLWAGAEDERFSIVISNESGAGGAALSRRQFGETVEAVNRFTHWFTENFKAYNDREPDLPIDQHMLISLIAPRAVYVASADEDLWADPRGEFLALSHASPAYALWNHSEIAPDEMPGLNQPLIAGPRGYHVRTGGHNLTPQDWGYFMDFADAYFESTEFSD